MDAFCYVTAKSPVATSRTRPGVFPVTTCAHTATTRALCDYFVAVSNDVAAHALDGPRGISETVQLQGVEPVVPLGRREVLLTGAAEGRATAGPRLGLAIVIAEDRPVPAVTGELTAARAAANAANLPAVAARWARAEEFAGQRDAENLARVPADLNRTARAARDQRSRMPDWVRG